MSKAMGRWVVAPWQHTKALNAETAVQIYPDAPGCLERPFLACDLSIVHNEFKEEDVSSFDASSILGLTSGILAVSGRAETKCKCLPGDQCFPDEATWNTLQQNLSRPLIIGQRPLASVCYENDASFNAGACASLTANQFDGHLRSRLSNALVWTNWEEVITPDGVQNCPFEPKPNATCFQGRVPSVSINVTTVEDIQHTIRFATEHNLHLVVKNQGHENLGRAFGVGSVELYVALQKDFEFHDSFVPEGAPEGTEGLPAVTIQPGVQWGDLYAAAAERNRTIVGGIGAGGTVGAGGGWPQGGGHGILSPYFGL
ncbi:hypothetical protein V5O48_014892, partial [Marasmius crinis-equi]